MTRLWRFCGIHSSTTNIPFVCATMLPSELHASTGASPWYLPFRVDPASSFVYTGCCIPRWYGFFSDSVRVPYIATAYVLACYIVGEQWTVHIQCQKTCTPTTAVHNTQCKSALKLLLH